MMRRIAILAAALACACAAPPAKVAAPAAAPSAPAPVPAQPAPRRIEMRNAGFESPMNDGRRCAPAWDCVAHSNPLSFRYFLDDSASAGRTSFCVERVLDEPWTVVRQAIQDGSLRGSVVRLSMDVRVENATGEGAGPLAVVEVNPPALTKSPVRGTSGWQRVAIEFPVPDRPATVVIGAMIEGAGRACFDDVRLEILHPTKRPQ